MPPMSPRLLPSRARQLSDRPPRASEKQRGPLCPKRVKLWRRTAIDRATPRRRSVRSTAKFWLRQRDQQRPPQTAGAGSPQLVSSKGWPTEVRWVVRRRQPPFPSALGATREVPAAGSAEQPQRSRFQSTCSIHRHGALRLSRLLPQTNGSPPPQQSPLTAGAIGSSRSKRSRQASANDSCGHAAIGATSLPRRQPECESNIYSTNCLLYDHLFAILLTWRRLLSISCRNTTM